LLPPTLTIFLKLSLSQPMRLTAAMPASACNCWLSSRSGSHENVQSGDKKLTPARWLILLGCIVLFCAGLMHLIGYSFLIPVLVKAGVDPGILGAVKAVWFVFTVELVILTPAVVWLSWRPGTRSLLLFLALIPVADAILMYHYVGPFIGAHLVAGGSLLWLLGAWLLPRAKAQSDT
jgi:hypothetical protein